MIIIMGSTGLEERQLPLADSLEYKLVGELDSMKMSLRMSGKSSNCVAIYIASQWKSMVDEEKLSPQVLAKIRYFDNDEDLVSMLRGTQKEVKPISITKEHPLSTTKEHPISTTKNGGEVYERVSDILTPKSEDDGEKDTDMGVQVISKGVAKMDDEEASDTSVITDVSTDLPTDFLCVPDLGTDSLKIKLYNKDKQIEQLQTMLSEARTELDTIYEESEQQMLELKATFEAKLQEAEGVVNGLKEQIHALNQSTGKYKLYSEHPKALLKEGFSQSELQVIKSLDLNLQVICSCGEIASMMTMVKKSISDGEDCVFIDLTGDYYLTSTYKSKDASLLLFGSGMDLSDVQSRVYTENRASFVSCNPYHDILLLDADWGTFLTNVARVFSNRRIFLLFNSITSFAVEYTVAKFSTLFRTNLFLRCNPLVINYAYGRLNTIPESRGIKWLVSDFYKEAETLLKQVGKKYAVMTNGSVFSVALLEE